MCIFERAEQMPAQTMQTIQYINDRRRILLISQEVLTTTHTHTVTQDYSEWLRGAVVSSVLRLNCVTSSCAERALTMSEALNPSVFVRLLSACLLPAASLPERSLAAVISRILLLPNRYSNKHEQVHKRGFACGGVGGAGRAPAL